jgi:putative MATE family efflux protein
MATVMALSLISGLVSGGVQPMVARRQGEGRETETALPLNGGLLLALGLGTPLAFVFFCYTPQLFPFLSSDPAVVEHGVPYVQVRVLAMAAVAMNFAFRGFWNGVNRSRIYLRTLIVMHTTNIVLDWILIFGKLGAPALGTLGAGIASSAATALGTGFYVAMGLRHARQHGFLQRLPPPATLRTMLRLGGPVGLQQFFFFVGFTALLWIVGRVGTTELAVANVVLNVTLVAILPGIGLGLAAASLVGQALGRGDPEDARRWGWDVGKAGIVCTAVLSLPMLACPDLVLQVFLHEPQALAVGRVPLQLVGATLILDVLGLVLVNALIGAGDSQRVFLITVSLQWGLALPAAWVVGPGLGYGLTGIWCTVIAWRCLQAGLFSILWQRGAWKTRRV